jgi:hypothetical protein
LAVIGLPSKLEQCSQRNHPELEQQSKE